MDPGCAWSGRSVAVDGAAVARVVLAGASMATLVAAPPLAAIGWGAATRATLGGAIARVLTIGPTVATGTAWALLARDARRLPVSVGLGLAGAWTVGLAGAHVARGAALRAWTARYRRPGIDVPHPDHVVVLGCRVHEDRVSATLAARLELALRLHDAAREDGHDPLLVVCGGRGADEPVSEAAAMARFLVARGVDPSRLVLEDRSTTTEENLRYAAALVRTDPRLGPGARGVVVTSDYHVLRALGLARRLSLPWSAVGSPTPRGLRGPAELREVAAVVHRSLPRHLLGYALVTLPLPAALVAGRRLARLASR